MEWLEFTAAIAAGLLLRFGLPVAFTVLLAWMLRRLDLRWQQEAQRLAVPARPLGASVAQIRCWETLNCPEERRQACLAPATPEVPCWQLFRRGDGSLKEECLECVVFRQAPLRVLA